MNLQLRKLYLEIKEQASNLGTHAQAGVCRENKGKDEGFIKTGNCTSYLKGMFVGTFGVWGTGQLGFANRNSYYVKLVFRFHNWLSQSSLRDNQVVSMG